MHAVNVQVHDGSTLNKATYTENTTLDVTSHASQGNSEMISERTRPIELGLNLFGSPQTRTSCGSLWVAVAEPANIKDVRVRDSLGMGSLTLS